MTLKDFANKIHNSNFIRIHKSYLINMRYINEINNKFLILEMMKDYRYQRVTVKQY